MASQSVTAQSPVEPQRREAVAASESPANLLPPPTPTANNGQMPKSRVILVPDAKRELGNLSSAEEVLGSGDADANRRTDLDASWDKGLYFHSENDRFHVHVGGNAQIDSTWFIGPQSVFLLPGGGSNGVGSAAATFLRRVRIRLDGDIYDQFDYVVEYDLANANNENDGLQPPSFGNIAGSPAPTNIWMQIRDVPVLGNVRFGNQVKPIGMTNNTTQAFLPFMERADNMDAFYGPFDSGFALGLTARNHSESERITWQYGIYRPSVDVFGVAIDKFEYGGRITALLVYEDEGRRLIHVGLGNLNGELPQDQLKVRVRPLLRNGPGYANPVIANTSSFAANRQYTIAPEFAMVWGPVTIQAEWTGQFATNAVAANGQPQGTVFFHGGYMEALCFLTGEYQAYDKKEGVFGRVSPRNDYRLRKGDGCRSFGAWQVGTRFSYVDLNDKGIQGGVVYNFTTGLNWFLNTNIKFQFNNIQEHRDQPGVTPGWFNGLGVRGAYDF